MFPEESLCSVFITEMFLHPVAVVGVEQTNPAGSADTLRAGELGEFRLAVAANSMP